MAQKGFNTLVTELRSEQEQLINKYMSLGLPIVIIKNVLDIYAFATNELLNKKLKEEETAYMKDKIEEAKEAKKDKKEVEVQTDKS